MCRLHSNSVVFFAPVRNICRIGNDRLCIYCVDLIGLISVQTIAANAVIQTEVQTNRSFAQRTSVSLVALTSRLLGCRVDNTFAVDAQFRFEISTFLNRTCCASGNQCGLDRWFTCACEILSICRCRWCWQTSWLWLCWIINCTIGGSWCLS
jgi:hypothetical protein